MKAARPHQWSLEAAWQDDTLQVAFIHDTGEFKPKTLANIKSNNAACMQSKSSRSLSLTSEAETTTCFPVAQGAGLEIVVAQFWKTEGCSEVSASVAFHGVSPSSIHIDAATAGEVSMASVRTVFQPLMCFYRHLHCFWGFIFFTRERLEL